MLRPTEWLSRTPDAMQDNGELSGQRHPCFAGAGSFGNRLRPILQARGSLQPRQDDPGSLVHQSTRERIAALRYPFTAIDLTLLSRRETKVRAYGS